MEKRVGDDNQDAGEKFVESSPKRRLLLAIIVVIAIAGFCTQSWFPLG